MLNLEKKNVRSIINARTLQMIVGSIGLAFPIIVPLGAYVLSGLPLQSSLSAYYFTATGDLFVGSLCAIGVCLLAYLGPQAKDNIAGDVAGVCAIGVALFPTFDAEPSGWVGWAHAVFAGIFFFTLAVFAGYLFTKSDQSKPMSRKKRRRNRFYRVCAVTILVCLIGIGLAFFLSDSIASARAIYWFEAIGIFAFGLSWFVKSEPRWLTYFSET
jgi:hypothetical protein